jgi:hypothetical protein
MVKLSRSSFRKSEQLPMRIHDSDSAQRGKDSGDQQLQEWTVVSSNGMRFELRIFGIRRGRQESEAQIVGDFKVQVLMHDLQAPSGVPALTQLAGSHVEPFHALLHGFAWICDRCTADSDLVEKVIDGSGGALVSTTRLRQILDLIGCRAVELARS